MSNFNEVTPLHYWVQKVLPLVYDDSLGYYELLNKVVKKLNDLIKNNAELPTYIQDLIEQYISSGEIEIVIKNVLANFMLNVKYPPEGLTPASGNGTTDDTIAIQGCIDYAFNHGGMSIYFPSGKYLTQSITLKNKTSLFGQDRYTTQLVLKGGATTSMFTGNVDEITLNGLGFDGNMDIQVNNIKLFDISVNSAIITNALFTDGYDLLKVNVNKDLQLSNSLFLHAVENGLVVSGGGYVQADNLIFDTLSALVGKYFVVLNTSNSIMEKIKCVGTAPNCFLITGDNNTVKFWNEQSPNGFGDTGVNNSVTIYSREEIVKLAGSLSNFIGGNSSETVLGNKFLSAINLTETITGTHNENVTGNHNVIVGGSMEHTSNNYKATANSYNVSAVNSVEEVTGNKDTTIGGVRREIVSGEAINQYVKKTEFVTTTSDETVNNQKNLTTAFLNETLDNKTVTISNNSIENVGETKTQTQKILNVTSSEETKFMGAKVNIATSEPLKYMTPTVPTGSDVFKHIPMTGQDNNQYLILVDNDSVNKINEAIQVNTDSYDLLLAQEYGIITSNSPNIKTVSNVTELKTAIDTVVPDAKNLIYLQPGFYDMLSIYPSTTGAIGCIIPNNTYLIGMGSRSDVQLDCTLPSPNLTYSCINLRQNGGLFNLTLNCSNTRYAVHDDDRFNGECVRICKNVMFNCYNQVLQWCYGAGINTGNKVIFETCKFNGLGGNIYFHNMYGGKKEAFITIKNCNFKMRSGGYDPYEIVLEWEDSYDGIPVENEVFVSIENSNVNQIGMKVSGGYSLLNKFNVSIDKPTVLMGVVDWEKIIMPNIKRVIADASEGTIAKGSVVVKHDYNKVWRFPDSWNQRFSYGIVLTNILNDASVIVCTDGYFYPYQLNVTGGVGGNYLTNTNGVLGFATNASTGAIGFQTADNEIIELALGTKVMYGGV